MLKRKLQVPPSTFTLKNPARDKWAQQSHPAEDSSSRACPTDAAHDPRTQSAACGEVLTVIREELLFCVLVLVSLLYIYIRYIRYITSSLIANISCYTGAWHKYWSWLWFIHDTFDPWNGPRPDRQPLQHPGSCFREPTHHSPELLLLFFFFFSLAEAAAYRQTRGIRASQGVI